jgi:2-keto-4-pentenoate hydratase
MTTDQHPGREIDHAAEARRIVDGHRRGITLDPISRRCTLAMDDAYAIQAHVTAARLARGERRVGWKLGYTSAAMREQMGIDAPNFGPLTDAMLIEEAGEEAGDVAGRFTQPRVEPEVALRFDREVLAAVDVDAVLAAVGSAHAALEIVDSVWHDYTFTIEDNTADGSSAAGVVLGPEIPLDRIAEVAVVLLADGVEVGRGRGRDASGHPANGVVWLVRQLSALGERLGPGDVVITGGLTAAIPLPVGGEVTASFDHSTVVCVRNGRTA